MFYFLSHSGWRKSYCNFKSFCMAHTNSSKIYKKEANAIRTNRKRKKKNSRKRKGEENRNKTFFWRAKNAPASMVHRPRRTSSEMCPSDQAVTVDGSGSDGTQRRSTNMKRSYQPEPLQHCYNRNSNESNNPKIEQSGNEENYLVTPRQDKKELHSNWEL